MNRSSKAPKGTFWTPYRILLLVLCLVLALGLFVLITGMVLGPVDIPLRQTGPNELLQQL